MTGKHRRDTDDLVPNPAQAERPDVGMGVSSERVGHAGPGRHAAMGTKDTSAVEPIADPPPEQSRGGEEPKPDGLEPVAGYPSLDPRSREKPFKDAD